MPDIATDKIEQARIKLARAKARLQMLEARARKATRARQTRRKVILGGLLLREAIVDPHYAKTLDDLLTKVEREQDQSAFKNWTWRDVSENEAKDVNYD